MSLKATTAFVKYMYGFDAEDNVIEEAEDSEDSADDSLDMDAIKELISVAVIYEDTLKGRYALSIISKLTFILNGIVEIIFRLL